MLPEPTRAREQLLKLFAVPNKTLSKVLLASRHSPVIAAAPGDLQPGWAGRQGVGLSQGELTQTFLPG